LSEEEHVEDLFRNGRKQDSLRLMRVVFGLECEPVLKRKKKEMVPSQVFEVSEELKSSICKSCTLPRCQSVSILSDRTTSDWRRSSVL